MMRALVVLVALAGVARADTDDDGRAYACHAASPTTKLRVQFKPGVSIAELATWATGFSCKTIIFSSDIAKHATKVDVIAPRDMTPAQALQLFVDAIEATGLVVVQKHDTIIIKLGPGMPATCPDLAATSPATPTPTVAPPPHDVAAEVTDADLDAGIRTTDATHRKIARGLVDKILANPLGVARSVRFVAAQKDGRPDGFKLYSIQPGSVYARLGLENGDALERVGGIDLSSADKALDVYTKLSDAKHIDVTIVRRGVPMTLAFDIQ
jgi:type II secretory pathway component PulC